MNDVNQHPSVTEDDAVAGASADQSITVGTQLRAAREAARLTLDEVAQSLKFSPRQIELLEADDYAALPGSTIVRGFVRSYARLLRVDADQLLRDLETALPSAPIEVRPPENMGVASQPRSLGELSPILTVGLVLLLATALLVLWHFFGPTSSRPGAMMGQVETQQTQAGAGSTEAPPAPVTGVPATSSGDNAMPPQASLPIEGTAPALHFVFADRSWVEVTDASRQLLHSGENPGGSQLTLTGRPPFEMVIGNASKVTLTYGERLVDLAPYMRADVARLTLE